MPVPEAPPTAGTRSVEGAPVPPPATEIRPADAAPHVPTVRRTVRRSAPGWTRSTPRPNSAGPSCAGR